MLRLVQDVTAIVCDISSGLAKRQLAMWCVAIDCERSWSVPLIECARTLCIR